MWPSNQGEEEPTFQLYFVVTKSFFLTAVSSYTCLLLMFDFFFNYRNPQSISFKDLKRVKKNAACMSCLVRGKENETQQEEQTENT